MSILNEELEERYPIEEGDCITLTREQLALQLRRAYKAGATRDYKRTPHGHTELVEIIGNLQDSHLLPDGTDRGCRKNSSGRACQGHHQIGVILETSTHSLIQGDHTMSWDKYQSRDPRRIDPMKTPLYDYVVLDTETTGFKPENGAKLIEIGAVKIHDGKLVDRYEQLIDPHQPIPEYITSLTGINDSMVIGQPDVSQAIIRFDKWLGPRTIIMAHNASFDLSFLDAAMKTVNGGMFFFPHRFVDTLEMSRNIHPEKPSHKVAVLIRDYGIGDVEEHRALSDATQENMLYEAMRREEFGR